MLVTISENRIRDLIRQLEGINDTDDELMVRFDYYSQRLFRHVNDTFGLRFAEIVKITGTIAAIRMDISGVGRDWQTHDVDWQKLIGGLQFLNVVSVSIEESDLPSLLTTFVLTAVSDSWDQIEPTLQRLSVSELQSRIEAACLRFAFQNTREPNTALSGDPQLDEVLLEEELRAQYQRAGVSTEQMDRLAAQKAFDEWEIRKHQEAEQAKLERMFGH